MDADFPYQSETQEIIGCAFEVLNGLGHGFHEKPYENALVVEFSHREIPYQQQARYPLSYRNVKVGEFIPDQIAFEKVVVDAKVIPRITDVEIGQMINYLRITKLPVGLILNFKNARLEHRRVVLNSNS